MKIYSTPNYDIRTTPSTPPSGFWDIYPKDDGWYILNDLGQEFKLATGGSGVGSYSTSFTPGIINIPNTVTHNLDTTDIDVVLWSETTGEVVVAKKSNRTLNTVDITFTINPVGDVRIVVMGGSGTPSTVVDWSLTGNVGTDGGVTNFIGTIDNVGFAFRTNNIEALRILANGFTGFGTTSAEAKVHIVGLSGATLKIVDGNQGLGKVLTSDATGQASWQTPIPGVIEKQTKNTSAITVGDAQLSVTDIFGVFNPRVDGVPKILINGLQTYIAKDDTERTTSPVYFGNTSDTAIAFAALTGTENLYFNGEVAGYNLTAVDYIVCDFTII